MNTVTVKNLEIGAGIPKVIVSLMGKDAAAIRAELPHYQDMPFDILEWRADYCTDIQQAANLVEMAKIIKEAIPDKPLLFTFRSAKEGGEQDLAPDDYVNLNKAAIDSGFVDMIDLELFTGEQQVIRTVTCAHNKNIRVIMSSHDFHKTPPREEIVARLCKMQELGADILKIALMPQNPADVLTLLSATLEMKEQHARQPLITMSMSQTGVISRLAGELFGSAATFGAIKKASAPGQINVSDLRTVLTLLHSA